MGIIIVIQTIQKIKNNERFSCQGGSWPRGGEEGPAFFLAQTGRQLTFSGFPFSHPSKEGTGFQLENDTFQSNLIDIETTIFHTYTLDTTRLDQVPTCKALPPWGPASCFLSPIIRLVFDDGLHTWSHMQSQEVFHGSGPDLCDSVRTFK